MGLLNGLMKSIKTDTERFGKSETKCTFRTGICSLDFLNAQKIKGNDGEISRFYGLNAGAPTMIIGKSGTGKTTIAIQLGYNIIKKYDEGQMYILDFENGTSKERIMQLTGCSNEYFNEHFDLKQVNIYTETILNLVNDIHEAKMKYAKELMVDNAEGLKDPETGKIIKVLPPTIIMIDSWAMMSPRDFASTKEKDFNADTHPMKEAKITKAIFKQIVQPCKEANIIILSTNHINDNISTGITPPVSILRYLKNTESLPGGKALAYVTDSLIKIEAAEKLDDRDDKNVYGVKGFKANIVLVKSRLAPAGRNIVGIFSQDLGFDEILCGFELLKQFGGITGTGSYALAHHPEVKFRLRELKTKYAENAEFRKAFDDEVEQTGDALVKVMTREELNNIENTNHNDLKEAELEDTAVETKEEEAK